MRGENILAHPRFAVGTKYEVARTDYNFIFCPYSKTSFGASPEYSLLSHIFKPGGRNNKKKKHIMRGENILVHPRFAVGTKYEVARTDYNFIFCPYSKTSFGDLPEYSLLSHDLQPGGRPPYFFLM